MVRKSDKKWIWKNEIECKGQSFKGDRTEGKAETIANENIGSSIDMKRSWS